ncbi:MAG: hypothetical protein OYG31_01835 [Candidatus Kaiserbacteria bacterium]|nr:hypothetical protein [Candidatus Kaiserbacteria bacterium]
MLVLWGGVAVTACSGEHDRMVKAEEPNTETLLAAAKAMTFDPCSFPVAGEEGTGFINYTCTLDNSWPTTAISGQYTKGIHWGANNRTLVLVGSPEDDNIVQGTWDIDITIPTDGTVAEKTDTVIQVADDDSTTIYVEWKPQVITQAKPSTVSWNIDVYYRGDPMTWPVGTVPGNNLKLGTQRVTLTLNKDLGKSVGYAVNYQNLQTSFGENETVALLEIGAGSEGVHSLYVPRSGDNVTAWRIDGYELVERVNAQAEANSWPLRMSVTGTDYRSMPRATCNFVYGGVNDVARGTMPPATEYSVTHGRVILKTGRQVVGGVEIRLAPIGLGQLTIGDPVADIGGTYSNVNFSPDKVRHAGNSVNEFFATSPNEVNEVLIVGVAAVRSGKSYVREGGKAYTCTDGTPVDIGVSISKGRGGNSRIFDHVLLNPDVSGSLSGRLARFNVCP